MLGKEKIPQIKVGNKVLKIGILRGERGESCCLMGIKCTLVKVRCKTTKEVTS